MLLVNFEMHFFQHLEHHKLSKDWISEVKTSADKTKWPELATYMIMYLLPIPARILIISFGVNSVTLSF